MLFMHLLYLFFWPIYGYEDEYYFPVYFLNECIKPVFGKLVVDALRTFLYITMYTYISSASIQVHTCFYMLSHMEFQMIKVEDNLLDIGKMVTKSGGIHQRRVNENLKVCIRHYMIIMRCMEQLKSWIFWPMAMTLIGSLVMLLSFVYFVIAQASPEAFPRVLSLSGVTICSSAIYALCGQRLEDQCERVNNSLYSLPWFRYNKKNCELLRLFMVATNTPLHLSLLSFVDVDMLLVVKVYKFIFSSFATIRQVDSGTQK